MLNDTNKALKFDDIEANVDIKKSSNMLLYKMFITLNQNSREYNFIPLDLLQREGKYQVVRDLYQQKILSIKNDINNGHPSLAKLQAEFGADVDNAFEADDYIDPIQFNNIKSYHFIREKITALTVHAEAIIENDQSDTAKAKAWSLIAEANYLSGLLTAENLKNRMVELISQNNSKDNEIKKITKFFYEALDKWDRETVLYKDIINTASTFMDTISFHAKIDNIDNRILDHTKEEYLAKVATITEGTYLLRNQLDTLVQKRTDTTRKIRSAREVLKEKFKTEFLRVLKESNGVKWKSIYHAIEHHYGHLEAYVKEDLPTFTIVKPSGMVKWVENKENKKINNNINKELLSAFFVNYEGAADIKRKFILFLRSERPTDGWSIKSAVELFQEKNQPSKQKIVVSRITDMPLQNKNSFCCPDLSLCLEHWLKNDDIIKEEFNGALSSKRIT